MRPPRFPWGWKILTVAMLLIVLTSRSTWILWLPSTTSTSNVATFPPSKGHGFPPVLAFWISGSTGEVKRMTRLLKAIYHPRNQYLLELDAESSDGELADLAMWVESQRVFGVFGNVNVVGKKKSFGVNQMGASALAAMLHAAAVLMRLSPHWDWFLNLSPDEYPLVTPDDLLHALTSLPRDANFVHYTNSTDWKEKEKKNQIVVDPSLHLHKGSSYLYYAVENRDTPDAFHIFGGSPRVILTRHFLEYCVQGWDNLPRKLLMYFTNTAYPLESYFHTVLCNSPDLQNATLLNSDLRHNIMITDRNDLQELLGSGAVFARAFRDGDKDDQLILDKVDEAVFKGRPSWQWCVMNGGGEGSKGDGVDSCPSWGNSGSSSNIIDVVKEGPNGIKLQLLLSKLVSQGRNTTLSYCTLP